MTNKTPPIIKEYKIKGYAGIWKKEVRENWGLSEIQNFFVSAESPDAEKKGKNKYAIIDFPIFYRRKDAKEFFNSKDWLIRKVFIVVED